MKTFQILVAAGLVAAFALLATSTGEAGPPAPGTGWGDTPPDVVPGNKLYWVQTGSSALQPISGTTPVEVLQTRGNWVLVDSNGINFGPVWLNFDEVLHYKTQL